MTTETTNPHADNPQDELNPQERAVMDAALSYGLAIHAFKEGTYGGTREAFCAEIDDNLAKMRGVLMDVATGGAAGNQQDALEERNKALMFSRDASQTALSLANGTIERYRQEARTAQANIERLNAQVGILHTSIEQLEEEVREQSTLRQQRAEMILDRDRSRTERAEAIAMNENLRREVNQLTTRISMTMGDVTRAKTELADFKEKVIEVADRYANEHDMCEVVDDALKELGLERKKVKYRATLMITVELLGELIPGMGNTPVPEWVLQSIGELDSIANAIRGNVEFDSEHAGGEVVDVAFDVTRVRSAD